MTEKMRIAETVFEMRSFLDETLNMSHFELDRIDFTDQTQWIVKDGALSHVSNGFFHVTGIHSCYTQEEHLVLYQPQSALTGIAICIVDSLVYLLLQVRIEPGNSNIGQYGPTIQSTPANYLQVHNGKKTSYVDLFTGINNISTPLGVTIQLDIGKRYFLKSKTHNYLETKKLIETEENMIWVPLHVIKDALTFDNFLNADLRSLISVFDWDLFLNRNNKLIEKQVPASDQGVFSANNLGKKSWEMIPLEHLKNWEIRKSGVVDIADVGIWVDMFRFSCTNREVSSWCQPLMCCSGRGRIILFMRKINMEYEFLVSIESEFGITGEITVLPSNVTYPNEFDERINTLVCEGVVIAEMVQCEEGGRFYSNESIYQVVLIGSEFSIKPNQKWISGNMLKSVLKTSNRASFQLRCISSMILHLINPYAEQQEWKINH
ncbi:MAG: NDP-hexose 2,3-dehydratase family protein [Bacteroidetes bacterium]|nr:NDP-hexose 2,3-dehydratase family protein [Bacteroidota bacterium]